MLAAPGPVRAFAVAVMLDAIYHGRRRAYTAARKRNSSDRKPTGSRGPKCGAYNRTSPFTTRGLMWLQQRKQTSPPTRSPAGSAQVAPPLFGLGQASAC